MKLDLLLHNRLGDAIMGFPAVLCLRQLMAAGLGPIQQVRLIAPPALCELVRAASLFPDVAPLGWRSKARSWLQPADRAYFFAQTSQTLGYHAKATHGQMNRKKWYSRFDHHTGFLSVDRCEANLPAELFQHFHGRLGLSLATVRFFGVCLDVGYTESQIIEHFQPDWQVRQGFERLGHRLPNGEAWAPHGYLTLCTEVAYGSHREAERRWPPEAYLQIAERAWQTYGLPTVLLGLEDAPLVSRDMHYLKDCRRLPRLADTAMWLAGSRAYLGNDSGLLHLANLLGVPTVGVYRTTEPHSSGPIQPWLNRPVVRPESIDEVWQAARAVLEVPAGVSAKA